MMRVLVAVSFLFALSLALPNPTQSPFLQTDSPFNAPEQQPFCPSSWMVTIAIRNVPKLDKDSGSDEFFGYCLGNAMEFSISR